MAVTLKEIALKVGKSITTVSRALHDYEDVSPDTKALVRRVADELGYHPNSYAQRLQKRTSDTIGFIIPTYGPRFSDPFFSEFLAGMGNKANLLGYDLLVSTQPPGDPEMSGYRQMVESRRVDGFIIVRTRRQDSRINYLKDVDFPFVAFGRVEGDLDFPYVDEDSEYGMRLVANHLARMQFDRVGCIVPELELNFANERLRGLRDGLDKSGLGLDESLIMIGDLTQRSGYEKASELLDRSDRPNAIAACNDLMAFGAMRAAQERGLAIGRDIAITGFDDIPLAENTHPPLTTVHQPIYKIGGMVCEMLIKLILSQPLQEEHIILQPNLVIRQSCGEKGT